DLSSPIGLQQTRRAQQLRQALALPKHLRRLAGPRWSHQLVRDVDIAVVDRRQVVQQEDLTAQNTLHDTPAHCGVSRSGHGCSAAMYSDSSYKGDSVW